jgi:hypothetical protein
VKDPKEQENLITALIFFAVVATLVSIWAGSVAFAGKALLTGVVFTAITVVVWAAGRTRR